MNARVVTIIACGAVSASLLTGSATAAPKFFGLFGKPDPIAPSTKELSAQEAKASALLLEASQAEQNGDSAKAAKIYNRISLDYPFTKTAATAAFRAGQQFEKAGKIEKAFDAYQALIDGHGNSPEFATALERQFTITNDLRNNRGGFFGIGSVTSDRLVEMYESVIKNGNRSVYAPKAQYAIGEIYAEQGLTDKSREAFQKVVDTYPESPEAPEAAYKIGKVNFAVSQKTRDASNLMQAKEAFESAVTLFGQDPQATEAQQVLLQISEAEADKAFKTAQFYQKKGQSRAAAIYYQEVLKCPTATHLAEAKEKLEALKAENPDLVVAPSPEAGPVATANSNGAVPQALPGTTKVRPDYFGPPGPKPRPKMRLGETGAGFAPQVDPTPAGAVPALPEPGAPATESSAGLLPSTSPTPAATAPLTELPPPAATPAPAPTGDIPAPAEPAPTTEPAPEAPKTGN